MSLRLTSLGSSRSEAASSTSTEAARALCPVHTSTGPRAALCCHAPGPALSLDHEALSPALPGPGRPPVLSCLLEQDPWHRWGKEASLILGTASPRPPWRVSLRRGSQLGEDRTPPSPGTRAEQTRVRRGHVSRQVNEGRRNVNTASAKVWVPGKRASQRTRPLLTGTGRSSALRAVWAQTWETASVIGGDSLRGGLPRSGRPCSCSQKGPGCTSDGTTQTGTQLARGTSVPALGRAARARSCKTGLGGQGLRKERVPAPAQCPSAVPGLPSGCVHLLEPRTRVPTPCILGGGCQASGERSPSLQGTSAWTVLSGDLEKQKAWPLDGTEERATNSRVSGTDLCPGRDP